MQDVEFNIELSLTLLNCLLFTIYHLICWKKNCENKVPIILLKTQTL